MKMKPSKPFLAAVSVLVVASAAAVVAVMATTRTGLSERTTPVIATPPKHWLAHWTNPTLLFDEKTCSAVQGLSSANVRCVTISRFGYSTMPLKQGIGVTRRDTHFIYDKNTIDRILNCLANATIQNDGKVESPMPSPVIEIYGQNHQSPSATIHYNADRYNDFHKILEDITS